MKKNMLILQLLLVVICSTPNLSAQTRAQLQSKGLYELAQILRPNFTMGTHTHSPMLNIPEGKNTIIENYNLISVGIYMKQTQKNSQDNWNFASIDPLIDFGEEENIKTYAHPMFGSDGYAPDWLKNNSYTNAELRALLKDRVQTILSRYNGQIDILDVYNEALNRSGDGDWRENDNLILQLGWHQNSIGRWPIGLEKLLVWSRQYGGDDLNLIYNDNANTLDGQPQVAKCIQMYKALKHEGIPIDGIGIQCHTAIREDNTHHLYASGDGPVFDLDLFKQNLQAFEDAGIDVYLSECDVHLYGTVNDAKLQAQAIAYKNILQGCIESPACVSFKTWGFSDSDCWVPFPAITDDPQPMPFDHDFNPKPAYFAMRDLLIDKILDQNEGSSIIRLENLNGDNLLYANQGVIKGGPLTNTGDYTKWEKEADGSYFTLKNMGSGKYLASNTTGDDVVQVAWIGDRSKWKFTAQGSNWLIDNAWKINNGGNQRLKFSNDDVFLTGTTNGGWVQWAQSSTSSTLKAGTVKKIDVDPNSNDDSIGYSLYPNPSENGDFYITTNGEKSPINVSIYSIQGKKVYNQIFEGVSNEIKVNSHLRTGVYIVNVQSETGVKVFKLSVK